MRRLPLELPLLACLAAACGLLPPPPSGTVLFQDDFSRRSVGWEETFQPTYSSAVSDGAYQIRIDAPDTLAWSSPRFDLRDVRLEVDTAAAGPLDNAFGLVCRYRDPGNFVFFLISSDGYSGIGQVRDGERSLLTGEAMLPSDAILQGPGPNHLSAECIGNRVALYINGSPANEVLLAEAASGDVGVIAGSYRDPGVVVRFDNFAVLQP